MTWKMEVHFPTFFLDKQQPWEKNQQKLEYIRMLPLPSL